MQGVVQAGGQGVDGGGVIDVGAVFDGAGQGRRCVGAGGVFAQEMTRSMRAVWVLTG
ncbi:hypothetical protein MMRN_29450 [Mycobacterium marinum]|nr:hypothetical protein MMRN_29450 [Mycobacterium marinum]